MSDSNKIAVDVTLYLVTDSTGLEESAFLDIVRKACEGGVTLLQLREKEKTGLQYFQLAEKVKRISDEFGIPLIIDDRVDIALAVDAAGVHVGADDIPLEIARNFIGADKILGATVKTVEQAKRALAAGVNYFGTGAIYPTTTKVITKITEVSTLNEIVEVTGHKIPVCAIGGLNSDNINVLYDSSAFGIAVVSAIMKSEKPKETAQTLKQQVLQNFRRFNSIEGESP
ncbi:MAG: thiamine phosphate synthase [Oscillospiraceae bacterium]|nr:thiamine phosphate synthase [Oscillospiraceae bacterium]